MPTLAEIRPEVVKAWKIAKARPLAEAEAEKLARAAEKLGGGAKLKDVADKRPVITTEALTQAHAPDDDVVNMNSFGKPRPAEIPRSPRPGDAIRKAIDALTPTSTTVAANDPKTVYYALSLREREPVDFDRLYAFGMGTFMLQ